jgi:hypothetical protein
MIGFAMLSREQREVGAAVDGDLVQIGALLAPVLRDPPSAMNNAAGARGRSVSAPTGRIGLTRMASLDLIT